jgi:hypothetical protein
MPHFFMAGVMAMDFRSMESPLGGSLEGWLDPGL